MARSINSFMCTDFCICPGVPSDTWVKEYSELSLEMYDKQGRAKQGYTGEINLNSVGRRRGKEPLFWTYDVNTLAPKPELVDLQSESFMDCLDNFE